MANRGWETAETGFRRELREKIVEGDYTGSETWGQPQSLAELALVVSRTDVLSGKEFSSELS